MANIYRYIREDAGTDMIVFEFLLVFILGSLFEACSVMWTHFSQSNKAFAASIVSMIQCTATIAGIGDSIHNIHIAPAYILGYGFGSFATIRWLKRLL